MENKRQNVTETTKKSGSKHYLMIIINLVLASASVYLFEFWFQKTIQLETLKMLENMGVALLTAIAYFIAKTYYSKGGMNAFKKTMILLTLFVMIMSLMLFSVTEPKDIFFPLSGVVIVSIAFYMLSLTTGTLNSAGIMGLSLIFAVPIVFGKFFGYIDWPMVAHASKFAVFAILFIGGTWAELRSMWHGIRGTNPDGNGFGGEDTDDVNNTDEID